MATTTAAEFSEKDWSAKTRALAQALDHAGKAVDELRLAIDSLNAQQLNADVVDVAWVAAERVEARLEEAFSASLQGDRAAWNQTGLKVGEPDDPHRERKEWEAME